MKPLARVTEWSEWTQWMAGPASHPTKECELPEECWLEGCRHLLSQLVVLEVDCLLAEEEFAPLVDLGFDPDSDLEEVLADWRLVGWGQKT